MNCPSARARADRGRPGGRSSRSRRAGGQAVLRRLRHHCAAGRHRHFRRRSGARGRGDRLSGGDEGLFSPGPAQDRRRPGAPWSSGRGRGPRGLPHARVARGRGGRNARRGAGGAHGQRQARVRRRPYPRPPVRTGGHVRPRRHLHRGLHDVAFAVAPSGRDDADELLDQIEARELLGAVPRIAGGRPPGAGRRCFRRSGRMAEDHPEIREIDVNPLLIDGSPPVAVDALIAVGEPVEVSTRPPADVSRLALVLAPRSVAVVGASADTAKWGGMLVANLQAGRLPGPHLPGQPQGGYDPRASRLRERHRPAGDPRSGDHGRAALAGATTWWRSAAQKGVAAVVVVSAGFSEVGPEGRAMEDEMIAIADKLRHGAGGPELHGRHLLSPQAVRHGFHAAAPGARGRQHGLAVRAIWASSC